MLGFLPWVDEARGRDVKENPSALAAETCARRLLEEGWLARFVPVAVSAEGIDQATAAVRAFEAEIIVALGQTATEPRVERWGRVPGAWAPTTSGEAAPWLLTPGAEALVARLNGAAFTAAATEPFRASDDAGAYFCDHLCVELVRDARARGSRAVFLHVTAIDRCLPEERAARLAQYAVQARTAVVWLLEGGPPTLG